MSNTWRDEDAEWNARKGCVTNDLYKYGCNIYILMAILLGKTEIHCVVKHIRLEADPAKLINIKSGFLVVGRIFSQKVDILLITFETWLQFHFRDKIWNQGEKLDQYEN